MRRKQLKRLVDKIKSDLGRNRGGEAGHEIADYQLCQLLNALGYSDVTELFDKVHKWYA